MPPGQVSSAVPALAVAIQYVPEQLHQRLEVVDMMLDQVRWADGPGSGSSRGGADLGSGPPG